MALAAAALQAHQATRAARPPAEGGAWRWHRLLAWHGAGLAFLATSLAGYFHLFDASEAGLHGFLARRALLSLLWLGAGVAGVLYGRAARATEVRDAGFLVLAAGAVKLASFDAATLDGALRVGALAAGGALLLFAAAAVRRLQARAG